MLQFCGILISVQTNKGNFGVRHEFVPGLNVIRAENSAGKSTLLRSLIYALGLEGMFSPSHEVPLPHVLTNYIDIPDGNATVIDSSVTLEIKNGQGQALTVTRAIAGDQDRSLIHLREGLALTFPTSAGPVTDYFVRTPGGASSTHGFHYRLAQFMGWTLPQATKFDGDESLLYLETLFPLFFVEQKLGWGRIPARFPTWYGIKDVRRRTVEFILKLDAYAIALERMAIQTEMAHIRTKWITVSQNAGKSCTRLGAVLSAIPNDPVTKWPPEPLPAAYVPSSSSGWEGLNAHLTRLRSRLQELEKLPVPEAGVDNTATRLTLSNAEDSLAERELTLRKLLERLESEVSEADDIEERIASLKEDQRKYKDLRKLRNLGSAIGDLLDTEACPTCHQSLTDSLMDLGQRSAPMSVDQNISFYDEQLQLFDAVLKNARATIASSQAQVVAIRADISDLQSQVRAARETLTSTANTPSIEALSERIRLEERIGNLDQLKDVVGDSLSALANMADDWAELQIRRKQLPSGTLSPEDERKIEHLQAVFQSQLQDYAFRSADGSRVSISRNDYEPELTDINLAADAAASDVIRLQWAYLLGLAESGSRAGSNHAGFLIFDEPQQQSADDRDFFKMLRYAKGLTGLQIIIATSHPRNGIASFKDAEKLSGVWELGEGRLIARMP